MNISNNVVDLDNSALYITMSVVPDYSVDGLYIFLENMITTFFYDIYNNSIMNKSLCKEEYFHVMKDILVKNSVNYIFILDSVNNVSYYINVSNEYALNRFIKCIVDITFV